MDMSDDEVNSIENETDQNGAGSVDELSTYLPSMVSHCETFTNCYGASMVCHQVFSLEREKDTETYEGDRMTQVDGTVDIESDDDGTVDAPEPETHEEGGDQPIEEVNEG